MAEVLGRTSSTTTEDYGSQLAEIVAYPKGRTQRIEANLAAIETLEGLSGSGEEATLEQKSVLAAYTGWGGLSEIFDERTDTFASQRERLRALVTPTVWDQMRSTINDAFYTDPAYVKAIWSAIREAGVRGSGLEPGCGVGNFLTHAPEGVDLTGIEIDPMSARIAAAIHGSHNIRSEGFEDTPYLHGVSFSVGNVPFGQVKLYDPAYNPGKHSIHNHFIIKSLAITEPGGYVAVLSSSYTMDAKNPAARREMYHRADLLGAIRLPTGAHQANTNTDVLTDLLIFRVRKPGETPQPFDWEYANTSPATPDARVNDYFTTRGAANVLGTLGQRSSQHGPIVEVKPEPSQDTASLLERRAKEVCQEARAHGLSFAPETEFKQELKVDTTDADVPVGAFVEKSGQWQQRGASSWETPKIAKSWRSEFDSLMVMLNQINLLVEEEINTAYDSPRLSELRDQLRANYDAYVDKYGPLNRCKRSVSIVKVKDKITEEMVEEERIRTTYPGAVRLVRKDPRAALLMAIERYDEVTGHRDYAEILQRRQAYARYVPQGADTPEDALAICIEQKGGVELSYIAALQGLEDEAAAEHSIDHLTFRDPTTGQILTRAAYLCGDVKAKLTQARAAVNQEGGESYAKNVAALEAVIPKDIEVADISVEIGAHWIPAHYYEEFFAETMALTTYQRERFKVVKAGGRWQVVFDSDYRPSTDTRRTSYSRWYRMGYERPQGGGKAFPAWEIFAKVMNFDDIQVKKTLEDGKKVIDPVETERANEIAERWHEAFAGWLWKNEERAEDLKRIYNDTFNCLVPRSYNVEGKQLQASGLSARWQLRTHQRDAIARMIAEPSTGLFHEVGAGKTLEMVCGVMEQKRLGLINKPMVVVPNHLIAQFAREWNQAYPSAKLLLADTDQVNAKGRDLFFAQAITGKWDAILCTQSAFAKLSLSNAPLDAYLEEYTQQWQTLMDSYTSSLPDEAPEDGEDKRMGVKELNKLRKTSVQEFKRQLDAIRTKSENQQFTFDQLGVDYLVVDEAHNYKNLKPVTTLSSKGIIAGANSQRAMDLDMKLRWLRDTYGQRVCTLATGTPIANTLGEMWVMAHYLRPDLLQATGIEDFDAWAKNYAATESQVEVDMKGEFKIATRFARYRNVPELLTLWQTFADVKLSEDLDLVRPELEMRPDGQRVAEVVKTDQGVATVQFMNRLADRAERIKTGQVERSEDNPLVITSDGRKFALDYRIFDNDEQQRMRALSGVDTYKITETKADTVAHNIARIYHDEKERIYTDRAGGTQPLPGSLQIVFCDQGVPGKDKRFDVYNYIKTILIEHDVPAEKIAFIHEAKNNLEKDKLFARARSGEVQVLIGSSEKMGTGANIQDRAVALHHVDAPWRPAEVIQREGRIIRQGNLNEEVQIYRYVTERSTDAYIWQTLERKATFINQLMRGRVDGREVENIGEQELSFAEVKAIAAGNPLQIEKVRIENEVKRYQRRQRSWSGQQDVYNAKLSNLEAKLEMYDKLMGPLREVVSKFPDTHGEKFSLTYVTRSKSHDIEQTFTSRVEAAREFARAWYGSDEKCTRSVKEWIEGCRREKRYTPMVTSHVVGTRVSMSGEEFLASFQVDPHTKEVWHILTSKSILDALWPLGDSNRIQALKRQYSIVFTQNEIDHPTGHTIQRLEKHLRSVQARVGDMAVERDSMCADIKELTKLTEQTSPYESKLAELRVQMKEIDRQLKGAPPQTVIDVSTPSHTDETRSDQTSKTVENQPSQATVNITDNITTWAAQHEESAYGVFDKLHCRGWIDDQGSVVAGKEDLIEAKFPGLMPKQDAPLMQRART